MMLLPPWCWEQASSNGPGHSPSGRVLILGRLKHPATTNPRRWAVVRRAVLDRDGWRCVKCGKAGRLEVDHIIPVQFGGGWWAQAGLQTLCRGCHFDKSRADLAGPDPERDAWRNYNP